MTQKFDQKQVEMFQRYILKEYHRDRFIEKITDVATIDQTDGTFTQIGIRPRITTEIFTQQSHSPQLIQSGTLVAVGERNHLVKTLLEDKTIKKIKIKERDFTPTKLSELIGHQEVKILLSVDAKTSLLMNRGWMKHISFVDKTILFNSYAEIFPISGKNASKKIILLDELALVWTKQLFQNKITGRKEKLEIKIGKQKEGKVDVLIRSVNKLLYYKDRIKIIELI